MKRYMNILLCAGLLMGISSMRAEDEKPKSWIRQTGEIALTTTDLLFDYRMILPIVAAANLTGYSANMPAVISVLKQASIARLLLGILTQNAGRTSSATQGITVAALMNLARKDCWTSTFEEGLRSAAGLGLFGYDPSGNMQVLGIL